jgi:hypothetical protein
MPEQRWSDSGDRTAVTEWQDFMTRWPGQVSPWRNIQNMIARTTEQKQDSQDRMQPERTRKDKVTGYLGQERQNMRSRRETPLPTGQDGQNRTVKQHCCDKTTTTDCVARTTTTGKPGQEHASLWIDWIFPRQIHLSIYCWAVFRSKYFFHEPKEAFTCITIYIQICSVCIFS